MGSSLLTSQLCSQACGLLCYFWQQLAHWPQPSLQIVTYYVYHLLKPGMAEEKATSTSPFMRTYRTGSYKSFLTALLILNNGGQTNPLITHLRATPSLVKTGTATSPLEAISHW